MAIFSFITCYVSPTSDLRKEYEKLPKAADKDSHACVPPSSSYDGLVLLLYASPFWTTQQMGAGDGLSLCAHRVYLPAVGQTPGHGKCPWTTDDGGQEAGWGWRAGRVCGSGSVPALGDPLLAAPARFHSSFTSRASFKPGSFTGSTELWLSVCSPLSQARASTTRATRQCAGDNLPGPMD